MERKIEIWKNSQMRIAKHPANWRELKFISLKTQFIGSLEYNPDTDCWYLVNGGWEEVVNIWEIQPYSR